MLNLIVICSDYKKIGIVVLDIQILPSILAADQSILEKECIKAEFAGGDQIHIDVMDGVFVPCKNFTPETVNVSKSVTSIPQNVHLMVQNPEKYIQHYIEAGASTIHIHIESNGNIDKMISEIKRHKIRAGIAINPETSIEKTLDFLKTTAIDDVLIMTVNPGLGGQEYMKNIEYKILSIRRAFSDTDITVDGGIDSASIKGAAENGANIFVAGSYLYNLKDMNAGIKELRQIAQYNFSKNL